MTAMGFVTKRDQRTSLSDIDGPGTPEHQPTFTHQVLCPRQDNMIDNRTYADTLHDKNPQPTDEDPVLCLQHITKGPGNQPTDEDPVLCLHYEGPRKPTQKDIN